VKGALRPSNAKRLYKDEKSTERGEVNQQKNRKAKERKNRKVRGRDECVATLSDLYPSTCLAWEALPGV